MIALLPTPMMVLLGRTPRLLLNVTVPCSRMISGPTVSMYSRNCSVVVAVTVAPPAPPDTPFWPSAFTPAKPSAWLGNEVGGVVVGGVVVGVVVGRVVVGVTVAGVVGVVATV